jgi:hypothetical protein
MEQEGMTHCKACRDVNIHPTMHLLWNKQAEAMMEQKKHNSRARSVHSGRIHCLAEHTEALLAFIFELQKRNGSYNTDGGGEGSSNFQIFQ